LEAIERHTEFRPPEITTSMWHAGSIFGVGKKLPIDNKPSWADLEDEPKFGRNLFISPLSLIKRIPYY
jgi:hypothetical protein